MRKALLVIGLAMASMPFAFAQATSTPAANPPAKTTAKTKKHVKKAKTPKTEAAKPAATPTK